MECGTCHATIADKAIVCYRCGTPTARPSQPARPAGSARTPWGAVAVCVVAGVALAVLAMRAAPGSVVQIGAAVAALVAAGGAVVAARRR
jgi:hypothetical protein